MAVYFKGDRLAKAEGPSIQMAEMNAAKLALETCGHLFPHLDYQKKIVERSLKRNKDHIKQSWEEEVRRRRKLMGLDEINEECSKRNDRRLKEKKHDIKKKRPEYLPVVQPPPPPPPPPVEVPKKKKEAKVRDEPKEEGECSDDSDD